jgi:hypothetical protein
MVFQLLQPNVAVVVSVLLHVFYSSLYVVWPGSEPGGWGRVARRRDSGRKRWGRADGGATVMGVMAHGRRARGAVRRWTRRAARASWGARGAGETSTEEKRGSRVGLRHVDVRGLASHGTVQWIGIHQMSGRRHFL